MKRRTFFATIAASVAAKTTHAAVATKKTHEAFGSVPFARVLADKSLVLLPKGTPPFSVGHVITPDFIQDNYGGLLSKIHWPPIVKLKTFDGWTICANWMPKEEYYIVTGVRRT